MGIHRRIESHLRVPGCIQYGYCRGIPSAQFALLRSLKKTERLCSFEVPLCPELRPTCTLCGHLSILGTLKKKKWKKDEKRMVHFQKKTSQQPIPNPFLTWPWHDLPPACPGVVTSCKSPVPLELHPKVSVAQRENHPYPLVI